MKKTNILAIFAITLLVALSGLAQAAITVENIVLGGDSQERIDDISVTVTISNDADENVTGVEVINTINSEFNPVVELSSTTIEANNSITLTVTVDAPEDLDAVDNDAEALIHELGTITVSGKENGTTDVSAEADITLQVENNLEFNKVKVYVDGDSDTVKDGDTVDEDAKPGSEIVIEIEVENTFNKNVEIEDIEVLVEQDDDLDWDDDKEFDNLDDGDEDTVEFNLDIDKDADEEDYTVILTLTGTDENGAEHGQVMEFEIVVDKEKNDVKIQDVSFGSVTCDDENVRVTVDIYNAGSRDQDDVVLLVEIDELNTEIIKKDIQIDEGDDETEVLTLPLTDDVEMGEYYVDIYVYTSTDEDDQTDVVSETLYVGSCSSLPSNNGDDNDTPVVVEPEEEDVIDIVVNPPSVPSTPGVTVSSNSGKNYLDGNEQLYITLLIVICILLVVLIAVVIANNFGKNKKKTE